jgi:hypothetical protein
MKYCKNCKHMRRHWLLFWDLEFVRCNKFLTHVGKRVFAEFLRDKDGRCGYEAKGYEPNWWVRLTK